MKVLDIDSFIDCWKSFVSKPEFLQNYNGPRRTEFIVGKKGSSPFGNHFVEEFGNTYGYGTEDGLVDLSIYKRKFFKGVLDIQVLHKGWKFRDDLLEQFPVHYDVLLKNENSIENAYMGMRRLTCLRARLKVLVTYIWDPSIEGDDGDEAHKLLCRNLEVVIKQTNDAYPENGETNYILITGQRVNQKLIWRYTCFSLMSRLKQVETYVVTFDSD